MSLPAFAEASSLTGVECEACAVLRPLRAVELASGFFPLTKPVEGSLSETRLSSLSFSVGNGASRLELLEIINDARLDSLLRHDFNVKVPGDRHEGGYAATGKTICLSLRVREPVSLLPAVAEDVDLPPCLRCFATPFADDSAILLPDASLECLALTRVGIGYSLTVTGLAQALVTSGRFEYISTLYPNRWFFHCTPIYHGHLSVSCFRLGHKKR